jgi:hypothetical protein
MSACCPNPLPPSSFSKLTLLEVLDAPAGQGDPDLVDLGTSGSTGLFEILFAGHFDLDWLFLVAVIATCCVESGQR